MVHTEKKKIFRKTKEKIPQRLVDMALLKILLV